MATIPERFPAMLEKKIFLSIDEYAYFGGSLPVNLKLALAYGMMFNEMLRHTDFLAMSAFTMGVSTLDYSRPTATLNTTGLLFKMYGDHLSWFHPGRPFGQLASTGAQVCRRAAISQKQTPAAQPIRSTWWRRSLLIGNSSPSQS